MPQTSSENCYTNSDLNFPIPMSDTKRLLLYKPLYCPLDSLVYKDFY